MLNSRTGTLRIFTLFVPNGPDQNKNEKHTKVNREPERRKKIAILHTYISWKKWLMMDCPSWWSKEILILWRKFLHIRTFIGLHLQAHTLPLLSQWKQTVQKTAVKKFSSSELGNRSTNSASFVPSKGFMTHVSRRISGAEKL